VNGLLDGQSHADRCRQVVDDVTLMHQFADDGGREHRLDDQVEVRMRPQMRDVLQRARGDVIECIDLPTVTEEPLRQVGADEARATGDERFPFPSGSNLANRCLRLELAVLPRRYA
jgi:hypothetical protein